MYVICETEIFVFPVLWIKKLRKVLFWKQKEKSEKRKKWEKIQAADTVQQQGPVFLKTKEFRWNSNKYKKNPTPNNAASYFNLLFIFILN